MYIVRERRRRRWYSSTEFMSHISRALFFILLSHLVADFGQWISSSRQQEVEERLLHHHWGWLRMMIGAKADPWEFRDDGMFDPRRDIYWRGNGSLVSDSTEDTLRRRELATSSSDCGTAASSSPCCTECFGLSYCDVLNGYKVEDKYYPGEPTILGSCDNFEERASRLDVFGPSKTFRDTEACREMVLDYTCLWWGSANEMYTNRCGVEAQVHPCRSYCVQLAKTCANNVLEWQELCRSIDCPPIDDECMPGPYAQDPDEACYIYEYHSPLNAGKRNCFAALSILLSVWFVASIVMMATARGT